MICWICLHKIPDGEESRDHIVPNSLGNNQLKSTEWFWACTKCNNIRNNLPFLEVEKIQKLLDNEFPDGWGRYDILPRLTEARRLRKRGIQ